MTVATDPITTLPAVKCEPWCVDGQGHIDEWHPVDQGCHSEPATVPLSRYPLVTMSDGERRLEWVDVHLAREHEGSPHVCVAAFGEVGLELNKADALALAAALVEQANGIAA